MRINEKTGTGVSSEKEKVKESQSRSVTPPLDNPLRVPGRGRHTISVFYLHGSVWLTLACFCWESKIER